MNHIHKNLLIKQKSISCVQEILYHITKYRPRPVDKGVYMNNSIFLVYNHIIPYRCNSVNTLWKTFSLFTAYQILSCYFYFQGALTTARRRVTIQHLRRKEWYVVLCFDHIYWPRNLICAWPHSFWCFLPGRPHAVVGVFLLCSLCFSSLPADEFSEHFHTSKWWPHIIFSDTDLTTFLTIVTSGVHGDKMSGEHEKAVFA